MILYSDRYDTSAVALKEYLEDDGKYDVVALNESKYDSMRLLKTYNGLYKFTYRKSPFFNNVIVNCLPRKSKERRIATAISSRISLIAKLSKDGESLTISQ